MANKSIRDINVFFSREYLKNDLKRIGVRSGVNKALTNAASIALMLGSTVILARLLAPETFGLFAMVLSVTELARFVMEVGLGTATVQREKITHDEVNAFFWINFGTGLLLMISVSALSPSVAWFYGDRRLSHICMLLSITFFFRGLTVQHRALLERQMLFGYLGVISITSNLLSVAVAIALALEGFKVWALVWREIAFVTLYAGGVWLFCGWKPGFPRLDGNLGASLRFGVDLSGVSLVQYLTQNLDCVLIGRYWGVSALGLYSKAFQLVGLPIGSIRMLFWDVGLAPLSTLQNDAARYRQVYGRLVAIQSLLSLPIVVFLAIRSEETIRLVLGEAWIGAAPLLRILAVAGFFSSIAGSLQLVMVSFGKTRRYLLWTIISGLCTITAFIGGIPWGAVGVAYAYTIASCLLLLVALWYCVRETPVSAAFILRNIRIPVISCGGAAIAAMIGQISNSSALYSVIISMGIFGIAYLAMLLCIPGGRQQLAELWSYRKSISILP